MAISTKLNAINQYNSNIIILWLIRLTKNNNNNLLKSKNDKNLGAFLQQSIHINL